MYFKVELARLIREIRTVVVEAKNEDELGERLSDVYNNDQEIGGWEEDTEWGVEEGTHDIIGVVTDPVEGTRYPLVVLPKSKD